ncbi:hypothetical protein FRB90_000430 [Tulasnella sp. 427]|nr:hypothetical protein FRB90_000430 [Tulasnella sp. 427]
MSAINILEYKVETNSELGEIYYIPDFVSEAEEEYLLRKIYESPQLTWKTLRTRRLQTYGGVISGTTRALIPTPIPDFLTKYPDILTRLEETGAFTGSKHGRPNHILLNEYKSGQGIMPHEDGPSYFPAVGTISLGSHTVVEYYRYRPSEENSEEDNDNITDGTGQRGRAIDPVPVLSVLLEPRSLVVTTKELYTSYLHGISERTHDTFCPQDGSPESRQNSADGIRIANYGMLQNEALKKSVAEGRTLERQTRISLTCRDYENVGKGRALNALRLPGAGR